MSGVLIAVDYAAAVHFGIVRPQVDKCNIVDWFAGIAQNLSLCVEKKGYALLAQA
jgi:hypothetical protein